MPVVRVKAPATTANLGPGYDCLGLALDVWNTLEVETMDGGEPVVEITGEGEGELGTGRDNLVYKSMQFLFDDAGEKMPALRIRCENTIPLARGMGSSAAAIAGGLVAANVICSKDYLANDLLEMAATIEGHPDNVAAAVMGGMQLVIMDQTEEGQMLFTVPVNLPPELHAVVFVPEVRISTEDARAVLPETVSLADAVYNMGRVGLLVASMATNHPEYLAIATQDRLHQPYRQPLFPAMKVIFKAALDAGALGVFLSGSGSTVLALTQGREMTVAYEMAEAARQANVEGNVRVTQPTVRGAHLIGHQ
ncbi:MAG: homoserine kinase, partial [Chloroflexi bacterium]|jgi:homoserine kinase|nr:homoserine kinase [Chloroflexota bacterium]MDP6496510.1 homoserine kinase [Dehalococcoidia bacterium]MQG53802.1 homoserine kinase [SAR202 cluster bacterium]|tara:strand:+ start:23245 stop:24168 length:924 start_codon:yes stop_codon:yes gene_type:complete